MDSSSMLLIFVIFLLICMSAFFSASETAFMSANKVKLKSMANEGNKKAQRAYDLASNYDEVLSTILIGNNIVNIVSTSLATLVFTGFLGDDIGVTISTVVMTVLVLIFGEITPKSVAKEKAESFAMFCTPIIGLFIKILMPVNLLFRGWKKALTKVFHLGKYDAITEEELMTYVDEAQSGGEINVEESQLIKSAIEFNDLAVSDVLMPRVDVIAVEKKDSLSSIAKVFSESGHSRIPVYVGDIDHIVGIIHERDFRRVQDKKLKSISTIIKTVPYVSESMKISLVLRMLQKNKIHMAVVVDEFGGTAGIVTLEDIIEELVGEIWDEYDEIIEDMVENEDGSFLVNCNLSLEKFAEFFNIQEEYDVTSVGGWVMDELDKIPEKGDSFVYEKRLKVVVEEVESRRASQIHIEKIKQSGSNGDENVV